MALSIVSMASSYRFNKYRTSASVSMIFAILWGFSTDNSTALLALIRASSNKPSLVIVIESASSEKRMKKIFEFIDNLLKQTGKVGEYDQTID